MDPHPFDAVDENVLRKRQSAKWTVYPSDVLPAWVAEMDYPLAPPIRRALLEAIDVDDAGYASPSPQGEPLSRAFADWARATWGWDLSDAEVSVVPDVVTGIAELLRVTTREGDGVVIEPPVYPPFAGTVRALGRRVVAAPLVRNDEAGTARWAPDLDAIARAYAAGARVHLLCSPHNPTGIVYSRASLARIAELADAYDVLVLADEIHAPLTLPGAVHTPFPMISEAARRRSIVLTSASKAWNVAGLKAALLVACHDAPRAALAKLPPETPYHAGHFGVLASRAAFRHGRPWLDDVLAIVDRNRRLLAEQLRQQIPAIRYTPPEASYLAWLDCRALGLGRDPAAVFLERGRVAVSSGPTFGAGGDGFVRLNLATSRGLLVEAVRRMARAL